MKLSEYLPEIQDKVIKLGFRKDRRELDLGIKGRKGSGFIFCGRVDADVYANLYELYGTRQILMKYPSIDKDSGVDEIIILKGVKQGKFWTVAECQNEIAKGFDPWKKRRKELSCN